VTRGDGDLLESAVLRDRWEVMMGRGGAPIWCLENDGMCRGARKILARICCGSRTMGADEGGDEGRGDFGLNLACLENDGR
jgi:hypothetical protein